MDDIVITEVDSIGITRLKQFLQLHFHNKDPRKLRYFLGIEVTQSKQGINGSIGVSTRQEPNNPVSSMIQEWSS